MDQAEIKQKHATHTQHMVPAHYLSSLYLYLPVDGPKIYLSKMKVDAKLLKRDGSLCWIDKCRRKKDQVKKHKSVL